MGVYLSFLLVYKGIRKEGGMFLQENVTWIFKDVTSVNNYVA